MKHLGPKAQSKTQPKMHTTFNDAYGGIKSEHFVLLAATFPMKAELLEIARRAAPAEPAPAQAEIVPPAAPASLPLPPPTPCWAAAASLMSGCASPCA